MCVWKEIYFRKQSKIPDRIKMPRLIGLHLNKRLGHRKRMQGRRKAKSFIHTWTNLQMRFLVLLSQICITGRTLRKNRDESAYSSPDQFGRNEIPRRTERGRSRTEVIHEDKAWITRTTYKWLLICCKCPACMVSYPLGPSGFRFSRFLARSLTETLTA